MHIFLKPRKADCPTDLVSNYFGMLPAFGDMHRARSRKRKKKKENFLKIIEVSYRNYTTHEYHVNTLCGLHRSSIVTGALALLFSKSTIYMIAGKLAQNTLIRSLLACSVVQVGHKKFLILTSRMQYRDCYPFAILIGA